MQQMSDARQAVEMARTAGAEQHATELFGEAEALLKEAERLQQEERYGQSAKAATRARDLAVAARTAAGEAQQR